MTAAKTDTKRATKPATKPAALRKTGAGATCLPANCYPAGGRHD